LTKKQSEKKSHQSTLELASLRPSIHLEDLHFLTAALLLPLFWRAMRTTTPNSTAARVAKFAVVRDERGWKSVRDFTEVDIYHSLFLYSQLKKLMICPTTSAMDDRIVWKRSKIVERTLMMAW